MSDQYRFGDETPPPRRNDRIFRKEDDGLFYFMTREGAPVGPFETEAEAHTALDDFLEFLRLADLSTLAGLTKSLAEGSPIGDEGSDAATNSNTDAAVGSWDPQAIQLPQLAQLKALSARWSETHDLSGLHATEVDLGKRWTNLSSSIWRDLAIQLADAELLGLVQLFVMAEESLAGWEFGKKSPVILFAQELRKRKAWPKALTTWIRSHSRNRFLPYGSLSDRL